jgi:hypothetical protein
VDHAGEALEGRGVLKSGPLEAMGAETGSTSISRRKAPAISREITATRASVSMEAMARLSKPGRWRSSTSRL